jgi:hypothetical protein
MAGGRIKGELLLRGQGRGQSRSALSLPREDLALPFYETRGQATLVKREKKRKRRCMHNSCKGGGLFSCSGSHHRPWFCWLLLTCVTAFDTWCMHSTWGGLQLVGGCMLEAI